MDQPVAIDGVGLALDQIGPVRQPLLARRGNDASGNALVSLDRAELRGQVFVAADALARHPRIEEKRPEVHLHGNVRHQRERALDPLLADVAPGAHDVRDDIDLERFQGGHRRILRERCFQR